MNNLKKSETVAEPKMLLIELTNQQESNYFLDASANLEGLDGALPRAISYPSARKIKSRSKIKQLVPDPNDKSKRIETLRDIRYIKGCDSIFVDEQIARNVTPIPQEDVIWILNGRLLVFEKGIDVGKYRYLKAYEGNVDNPDRPDGAEGIFREVNTEIDAQETETNFDAEFEVMRYLSKLKRKVSETETIYDEDTLQFLSSLFKLPPFDSGYKSEAWVGLATEAKSDPVNFLKRISAERAIYESDVHIALQLGAVITDSTRAAFADGKKLITQFPENMREEEAVEKLIDFMSNPKNSQLYQEMRTITKLKKDANLAVIE